MERMIIKSKDDNNNEILLEGIATYHDASSNKDFIVYTDNTLDDKGQLKVYYSMYKKIGGNIKLIKITLNEDKKIGLMFVKEVIESLRKVN